MRALVSLALILALLVTIFAVQNNAVTTIKFLGWSVEGSAALVLMITFALGIIIGALLMTPGSVRNRLKARELRRTVAALERDAASTRTSEQSPPQADAERVWGIESQSPGG